MHNTQSAFTSLYQTMERERREGRRSALGMILFLWNPNALTWKNKANDILVKHIRQQRFNAAFPRERQSRAELTHCSGRAELGEEASHERHASRQVKWIEFTNDRSTLLCNIRPSTVSSSPPANTHWRDCCLCVRSIPIKTQTLRSSRN